MRDSRQRPTERRGLFRALRRPCSKHHSNPTERCIEVPPVHLQAFVIEDNPTIRENLIGTLEELTCVHVAGTSASEDEALEWLEGNKDSWDIMIVDLFLKQGSGMHLAQVVKRRRPSQKIIVFSNYINPSVRKRCAQIGVDAVFDKSTEIDALVDYCAHQCFRVSQVQAA